MKQTDFWGRNSDTVYSRLYAKNKGFREYIDQIWNIPKHNDQHIFELLSLSVFAAGLNFRAAYAKRAALRKVFHDWQAEKIAKMTEEEVQRALKNKAIIRNERKIRATINNARVVCKIQQKYGSLDCYFWRIFHNQQKKLAVKSIAKLPVTLPATDKLAKQMKKDGFTFVGPVSVCAFAISIGLIYVRPDNKGRQDDPVRTLTLKEQEK